MRSPQCITLQKHQNNEDKKTLEVKYLDLLHKLETLDQQLVKERNEKSLMFAQMQVLEAEYNKIKGQDPKQRKEKGGDVLSKIMISVKMQAQEEPKKEVGMSEFGSGSTKK